MSKRVPEVNLDRTCKAYTPVSRFVWNLTLDLSGMKSKGSSPFPAVMSKLLISFFLTLRQFRNPYQVKWLDGNVGAIAEGWTPAGAIPARSKYWPVGLVVRDPDC